MDEYYKLTIRDQYQLLSLYNIASFILLIRKPERIILWKEYIVLHFNNIQLSYYQLRW